MTLRAISVAAESGDPCSLLSWYRDLIRLRGAHPAFSSTTYATVTSSPDALVAELRWTPSETLLVVANTGAAAVADAALSLAQGPLKPGAPARLLLGAGSPDVASPVVDAAGGFNDYRPFRSLPAHSVSVISLGP